MNCRKGDLARIVRSQAGNEGRMVSVVEAVTREQAQQMEPFVGWWRGPCGPLWLVQPLQPLRVHTTEGEFLSFTMEPCVIEDAWLRPIRGEGLDDETPAGEELPQAVGA